MKELVLSFILAACGDVEYNDCMEFFVNCIVDAKGKVVVETMTSCERQYNEREVK